MTAPAGYNSMDKPPKEDPVVVRCIDFEGEEFYILWRGGEWRTYTHDIFMAERQRCVSHGAYNGILVGWKKF
jgi:hypothetical protein